MILVVDASVAGKWFVSEAGTDSARRLLEDPNNAFVAPDLLHAELLSLLWKHVRANNLQETEAWEVVGTFGSYFEALVPMEGLAPRAFQIAMTLDHPVYDCFYLALAEQRVAPLVTADKKLVAKVRGTVWQHTTRLL